MSFVDVVSFDEKVSLELNIFRMKKVSKMWISIETDFRFAAKTRGLKTSLLSAAKLTCSLLYLVKNLPCVENYVNDANQPACSEKCELFFLQNDFREIANENFLFFWEVKGYKMGVTLIFDQH